MITRANEWNEQSQLTNVVSVHTIGRVEGNCYWVCTLMQNCKTARNCCSAPSRLRKPLATLVDLSELQSKHFKPKVSVLPRLVFHLADIWHNRTEVERVWTTTIVTLEPERQWINRRTVETDQLVLAILGQPTSNQLGFFAFNFTERLTLCLAQHAFWGGDAGTFALFFPLSRHCGKVYTV